MLLIFFLFACTAPQNLFALANPTLTKLKSQFKQVERLKQLAGHFEQIKHFHELDLDINSSGTFLIQKLEGGKSQLEWTVQKPAPSIICMNHEMIVIIGQEKQTLLLSEVDQKNYSQIMLMMNLLAMNFDFLEKSFSVTQEKDLYVFEPLAGQNSFFQKIKLSLQADGKINHVQLFEKSQDSIEIKFSAQKTKATEPLKCLK